jgi:hypothetical protein
MFNIKVTEGNCYECANFYKRDCCQIWYCQHVTGLLKFLCRKRLKLYLFLWK